jgi:hypothetical protein
MVAPRAASPLQTVKLPHSRGKPTGRQLLARDKPTGRQLALAEASGLAPHVTPRPTGLPVVAVPPQRVRGLQLPGTLLPTGLPALVVPLQRVNEPQLPVSPPLAGLPAAEARVPSEAAPVDTTDLALAPPAAAVPPAWDLAEAEAAAEVAEVGADERAATSF